VGWRVSGSHPWPTFLTTMTNQSYPRNNDLSCEKVKELFDYKDGELFWKKIGPNKRTDRPAGAVNRDGYRRIKYMYKLYAVHRLVWTYHGNAPVAFIDHINGDVLDNRIENLRAVTHSQNCMNRKMRRNSTSGIKGVHWNSKKEKWVACVGLNYKSYRAGEFDTKEEAAAAVAILREKLHGEYAKH
jgi:hypothetical protein